MKWTKTVFMIVLFSVSGFAQDALLTVAALEAALAAKPEGAAADALVARLRQTFGADLSKPLAPKVDELVAAWAIEAPDAKAVFVVSDQTQFRLPLARVGTSHVFAGVKHFGWGDAVRWQYDVDGRRLTAGNGQLELYTTPPEAKEKPGVPKGKVLQMPKHTSKVFPGATRDWWIYVPAQYTAEKPAAVMVFQDGQNPRNYMPVILDNLIAQGDIPVMIGIFLPPGVNPDGRPNRSFEYDTLSDQYTRFLLEEIFPEVEKSYRLSRDPQMRAITGISSGGICAFTVAWERPDQFSKVLSWVGSFTNIAAGPTVRAGGHNYEAMIRKTPNKPIRVFLQDGENDLDNANGNWPLANQQMAKSLSFKGYDYKFEYGRGFHSDRHGRAILPDSLRWLWRGWR
jgi:enterochelin esterase family protein